MASTSRRPGLHLAGVTPAMRDSAIKMLSKGCPPSALGTLLPSPHPEYLRALYLGDTAHVDLFFQNEGTPTTGNDPCAWIDVNGNNRVIYFEEWSIKEVVKGARAKRQSQAGPAAGTSNSEPDNDEEEQHVTRNQAHVSRGMAVIQDKINDWKIIDQFRATKDAGALQVEVHDPLTRVPGAMESRIDEWREKLGWTNTANGHWFDNVPSAVAEQKFKFFTYAPAKDSYERTQPDEDESSEQEDEEVKYYWSYLSGLWKTAEGLEQEAKKLQHDRNAWTVHQISRIERERDEDLEEENLNFVTTYLDGIGGEYTSSGYKSASASRASKGKKSKKQVPTRGLGGVVFEPEDGGDTALARLADTEVTDKDKDSVQDDEAPTRRFLTPAVSKKRKAPEEPQPVEQPAEQPKKTAAGKRKAVSKRKRTDVADESDDDEGPAKRTRLHNPRIKVNVTARETKSGWQPILPPGVKLQQNSKGKAPASRASPQKIVRQASPEKEILQAPSQRETRQASALRETRQASAQREMRQASPKKRTGKTSVPPVKSEGPQSPPAATRKSSRVAAKKRKADDETDGDDVVASTSRAKTPAASLPAAPPAKKQKKASSANAKDTREATLSVEPSQQPQATRTIATSSMALPTIDEHSGADEEQGNAASNDTTEVNTITISNIDENVIPQGNEEQLTPRGPTSQTYRLMSPGFSSHFKPLTNDARAELLEMFPFLLKIPTNRSTTSSSSDSNNDNVDENNDEPDDDDDDRREAWLKFLNFFGRFASMRESLNRHFDEDGAVARERSFLIGLHRNIAKIRRIDDRTEGDNDGGEEEGDGFDEEKFVLL